MKMQKLIDFVNEKEGQFAYGSETVLMEAFVDCYGYHCEIDGDKEIDEDEFETWAEAYKRYEEFEDDGRDYTVSELF